MTWADVDAPLRRRIRAGEPAALKEFFEDWICRAHAITYIYTSDPRQWFARMASRYVSVPPMIDLVATAIGAHEAAHVVNGACPKQGDHQRVKSGCLECERRAWLTAETWIPFTWAMHHKRQQTLGTYRLFVPASLQAQQRADGVMSDMAFADRTLTRLQAADCRQRLDLLTHNIRIGR